MNESRQSSERGGPVAERGRRICYRVGLLNPNTSEATTALLAGIARGVCPDGVVVEGHTMTRGPAIITDPVALAASADQVVVAGVDLAGAGVDALIVSAFGDPGLFELRARVVVPVVGIAQAGMDEAAAGGRRFSIITTTPGLEDAIRDRVSLYGHDASLVSLRISGGDAVAVMSDPVRLRAALIAIARECATDGAEALLIGGGPLAPAAAAVADAIPLPVVDPVAAGMRQALERLDLAS